VVGTEPTYRDVYGEFRRADDETDWQTPPEIPSALPAHVADVRTYGARGDGRTNDLPAFVEALASLPGSGGVLTVPAGRYRLEPSPGKDSLPFTCIRHHLAISGRRNVHIRGAGESSLLLFGSADRQGPRFVDVADCSISNLRLELVNQPSSRRNRALREFSGARNCVVEMVTTAKSSGPGIRIDSPQLIRVTGAQMRHAGTYGIELAATRQAFVDGCTVLHSRDNAIESSWMGSINREPQYVRINDNRITGTREGAGIGIAGGDQVVLNGNEIGDTYLPGVYLYERCPNYPPKRVAITHNRLSEVNTGPLTYLSGAIAVHGLTNGRTSADVTIAGNSVSVTTAYGNLGGRTDAGELGVQQSDPSRPQRQHLHRNRRDRHCDRRSATFSHRRAHHRIVPFRKECHLV